MHVWRNATLTFGMVNIPVGVSSAVKEHKLKGLHGAHIKCGSAIRQNSRCETCGCDVSQEEVKLVYDLTAEQSIDIPKDEWDTLGLSASAIIQIDKTFPLQQLEPELIRKSYYLVPNKNFRSQYQLFGRALGSTKLAAKAVSVLGGKEYPAAVRAEGDVLTLNLMWCHDELVQPDQDFDGLDGKLNPQELALAKDIVRAMQGSLTADDLTSKTWDEQTAYIKAKVENGDFSPIEKIEEPAATLDMLTALRESMKQVKKQPVKKPSSAPRRKRQPVKA